MRLQGLLGHSSIQMTFDRYGHWLGDNSEKWFKDDRARFGAGEQEIVGMREAAE